MGQIWVAFDIDGTIFDCADIIGEAFQSGIMNYARGNNINVDIPSSDEIISHIGQPINTFFKNIFPSLDNSRINDVKDICMAELVKLVIRDMGKLYPYVEDTLIKLKNKGYKMVVASNGSLDYIEAILETYKLTSYFESPILSVETEKISSKSDILSHYKMKTFVGDSFFMVGDRTSDLNAARDNDIPFIGCSFGHAEKSELHGADIIINDFDEVPMAVKYIMDKM